MLPAHPTDLTRRMFVASSCGAACAAALSACATYRVGPAAAAPAPPAQPDAGAGAPGAATPSATLAYTSDIPIGGGIVYADQDVVVTQPESGRFRAFSATCTHQGCLVGDVTGGTINCNCHGSRFAVSDGAVIDGPADSPLPERPIQVNGDQILLA